MQKAIYRHIRLKKGFHNVEIMDGVTRLRIPDVLLREKLRTQSRFEVATATPTRRCGSTDDVVHAQAGGPV